MSFAAIMNCFQKWSKHVLRLSARMYPKLKQTRTAAISARMYPKLKKLNRISSFLSPKTLLRFYKQTILPVLDYGCI